MKIHPQFAICVNRAGEEDLVCRKVYELVEDLAAAGEGYVRVIDDSGEDYLYPEAWFVRIDIPEAAVEVIVAG